MTRLCNFFKGADWTLVHRDQLASLARATPPAMAGYGVNVIVAVAAFQNVIPAAPLLVWAALALGLCAYVGARSLRARPDRRAPEQGWPLRSARNACLFGLLLGLPWMLLATMLAGVVEGDSEVILMALAVGMAASGSVLLAPIPAAAVIYAVTILLPLSIKCLFVLDGHHLVLGGLALSFLVFLLALIAASARLFLERLQAHHELQATVAALSKAREETERVAMTDGLTGVANRRAFMARLNALSIRGSEASSYGIFYVDLDRFKAVNDTLGHAVGDILLKAAASRIEQSVRQRDLVARLGGDEFAILSHDISGRAAASALAERLVAALSEPFWLQGQRIQIGACAGVALTSESQVGGDQLLKHADLAMYAAKAAGRGGHCVFEADMQRSADERRAVETGLRRALPDGELELRYQPIRRLMTDTITSLEAQVWWRHPVRGLLPPSQFLGIAEENGLAIEIGRWVIQEACRQAAQWPADVAIAINLSPLQISSDDIVARIETALKSSGLPARRLEVEITEKSLLQNDAETLQSLWRLQEIGVSIALDDFGTGYSSLSYLVSIPFDRIKIDRLFVSQIGRSKQSDFIVRAVAHLAKNLNCSVVAAGIESVEQLQRLQALQISYGQGSLLGRPLPAAETSKLFVDSDQIAFAQSA